MRTSASTRLLFTCDSATAGLALSRSALVAPGEASGSVPVAPADHGVEKHEVDGQVPEADDEPAVPGEGP
jgi:hypothetical protein